MFIEIHAIQSLPPSNPNRGQDGNVKSATYGGVLRSRMSSQSQKRATRLWYQQNTDMDRAQMGQRSRRWNNELAPLLTWADADQRDYIARILITLLNSKADNLFAGAVEMKNLLFLANHEITKLAALGQQFSALLMDLATRLERYESWMQLDAKAQKADPFDQHPSKADLNKISKAIASELTGNIPGDIALFGRMMANMTETSVDGSVQVAHALSVNQIYRSKPDKKWMVGEVDFFSAVDDIAPTIDSDDSTTGMIGEISFTSPVHYRYANIAVKEVVKLMGDSDTAATAIEGFINGFVRSLPDGFSRQFAHQTMPEFVMIQVRKGCPYSLISAFEKPIDSPDHGGATISQQAVNRLCDRRAEMLRVYGDDVSSVSVAALNDHYPGGISLDDAIAQTHKAMFSAEM